MMLNSVNSNPKSIIIYNISDSLFFILIKKKSILKNYQMSILLISYSFFLGGYFML